MRICELREKEVINCRDGEKLGYISDIEFNPSDGCIIKVIIPGPCKLFGIFGTADEYVIPYCHIKTIGSDVILVDIDKNKCLVKCSSDFLQL